MSSHRSAQYEAEAEAQQGSKALYEAMQDQFLALANKLRITMKDARLFLMNGETPHGR